jgi:cephalosporin hydroxylase
MNDLEKYFKNNTGRVINKWSQYFDVYDRHFSKYRGKEIVLLEIGTFHGGSLQMWKSYFGDKAKIYGIDINPNCKEVEEENIEIFIGSQSDRKFLREVRSNIPPIDILIDDGGHTMLQQIVSFEELFDHIKPDGVYLCEDIHTSYWMDWGGGYKRKGTFVEYSKNFIDKINAYNSRQKSFQPDSFTKSVNSLHYYDSMLVIEKKPTPKPFSSQTGTTEIKLNINITAYSAISGFHFLTGILIDISH